MGVGVVEQVLQGSVFVVEGDRALSRIDIAGGSRPIVVRRLTESDVLRIQGGRARTRAAGCDPAGFAVAGHLMSHLHIEYCPGHHYLDGPADPLVVALE